MTSVPNSSPILLVDGHLEWLDAPMMADRHLSSVIGAHRV